MTISIPCNILVALPHLTSCLGTLQKIADFHQVPIWVSKVNGQQSAGCPLPLGWTNEDLDPKTTKRTGEFFYGIVS